LGFNAAFAQFLAAISSLNAVFTSILSIVPLYENLQPILDAQPEVNVTKSDPGELSGDIEIHELSFRYQADGPLVLDGISLRCEPGEFVAIVGPSGSGKSTLLRLLLGFETPDAGLIRLDGQDLAGLNIQSVRHQIGSVLQDGKVLPANIFTNIVGAAPLSMEDAWEAARLAGLDEDIRLMPMGMQTIVSEDGSTFSGGQRQRLMIARAIVSKPRILLLDEATSSLDNRTQEVLTKNLEQLQATRIVIAHRLSTIVNADRIYVIVAGKVVHSGTYEQLLRESEVFATLAKRQMVSST
jgi:ABC-type bacteriocin/lantibiotic exporter with double-glycine peptidase domain